MISRFGDLKLTMAIVLPGKILRWQLATIIGSILCAAIFLLQPDDRIVLTSEFLYQFFVLDRPASLLALAVALVAVACTDRSGKMHLVLCWISTHPRWLVGTGLVVSALGARLAYYGHPLSMDEYSTWLQSRIFAYGKLVGQLPPELMDLLVVPGFQKHFVQVSNETGAIASVYWPGLSLVMAPFTLAGVSWLCNPVLTAITLLGLSRLLEHLLEDPAARGFGLFAALASPVILINGMSYYGMTLQLLCSVMFTLGIVRGTPRQMLAAGAWASLGMTTVNPVPLTLYALPWLFWIIVQRPLPWRKLGWLLLGGLPLSLLLGIGWRIFLLNHVRDAGAVQLTSDIGSMLQVFQLPSAPLVGVRMIALIKLWLWAVPGLVVLAAMAYAVRERSDCTARFAASAALTMIGYLFVPFDQGNGWGYRYFHAAWLVLPVMAAMALQHMAEDQVLRQRVYGFAFAACVGTLLLSLPFRVSQVESFVSKSLAQIPERLEGNSRQAVFIDIRCGFHTYDRVQNDPLLRSNEIRLVSKGTRQDAEIAVALGSAPRMVVSGTCGTRWLLD